jgi:hypothetical protein
LNGSTSFLIVFVNCRFHYEFNPLKVGKKIDFRNEGRD